MNSECTIEIEIIRLMPEMTEVKRLLSSNKKLKMKTNWEQKITLEEGLKLIKNWFLQKDNLLRY